MIAKKRRNLNKKKKKIGKEIMFKKSLQKFV